MSTYFPSSHDITRKWFVVDANGKTLGRLATEAASMLAGKRNPKYTPFIDMGDHVIIVNAEKIVLTGLKSQQREESFVRLMARRPEKIVEDAIKGMLPKSKMGRQMATKLKVYRGDKHPHQAQQPEVLELAAR
jgi:large subunit ribosomal protein L13